MKKIEIYAYPFPKGDDKATGLIVDGIEIDNPDNRLHQFVVKKPVSKWLCAYRKKLFIWRGFFYELALELNASAYHITYYGTEEGYEEFCDEAKHQLKQLEEDGRDVKIELAFKEFFNVRKAVKTVAEALVSLNNYAYAHELYEICEKMPRMQKRITEVPCTIEYPGCSEEIIARVAEVGKEEGFSLIADTKHSRVALIVIGKDWTGGGIAEKIPALQQSDCAAIFVPAESREGAAAEAGGKIRVIAYEDDPQKAIENYIYTAYMPAVAARAVNLFYEMLERFDIDDAELSEAKRNIDALFSTERS